LLKERDGRVAKCALVQFAKFGSPPVKGASQPHSGASPSAMCDTTCTSAANCTAHPNFNVHGAGRPLVLDYHKAHMCAASSHNRINALRSTLPTSTQCEQWRLTKHVTSVLLHDRDGSHDRNSSAVTLAASATLLELLTDPFACAPADR
jgi:hypothetical protein